MIQEVVKAIMGSMMNIELYLDNDSLIIESPFST